MATDDDAFGTTTRALADMVAPSPSVLAAGTLLGDRFRILGKLGAGGMGVVYRARDEKLSRDVAIKVHRRVSGAERLHREATAMAQLSHPNVVVVYEVGQHEGSLFIAMELIDGETARGWRARTQRTWREVVRLYAAAGEGLAALHAAGLIHRDFKPENVLVGNDGRVRVADLGLARSSTSDDAALTPLAGSPVTGAAGTPAYMAPEQRVGGEIDERSDQYAFAASINEALAGLRPPRRIRRALSRALSPKPEDRWPKLAELLAALAYDPRPRLISAAVAVVLVAAVAAAFAGRRSTLCKGGPDHFAPAWNTQVRAAVHAALAGGRFADAWPAAEKMLDDYQAKWQDMYRDACEATRVRGEQSDQTLDRRMLCLDGRFEEVKALTTLLSAAGNPALEHTGDAVAALTPVATCGDIESLTAQVPPPSDANTRAAVAEMRKEVARGKALHDSGQYPASRDVLSPARERSLSMGYPPLRADAEFELAHVLERLGQLKEAEAHFREAAYAAEEGRSDEVAAASWSALVRVVGGRLHRGPEGEQLARQAEAALKRLHRPHPELELDHLLNLGFMYESSGDYKAELPVARKMLALSEQSYGPDDSHIAVASSNLGNLLERMDPESPEAWAAALPLFERALRIREKLNGHKHPDVADLYFNLASAQEGTGHLAEAEAGVREALKIGEATLPPGHVDLSLYLLALAELRQLAGDQPAALGFAERGLAIRVAAMGKDQPEVAEAHWRMADSLLGLSRPREALEHARAGLAIVAGQPSPLTVFLDADAGMALLELGQKKEAATQFMNAVELAPKVDVHDIGLAPTRFGLARLRWAEGKKAEARELATQARAGYGKDPIPRKLATAEVDAWLAAHK